DRSPDVCCSAPRAGMVEWTRVPSTPRRRTLPSMRTRKLIVVAVACMAVVAVANAAQNTGHGSKRPSGPLVPASGLLLGGYPNPVPSNWWTKGEVLSRERLLGRRYAIDAHVSAYGRGGRGPARGMTAELRWDAAYGRIPLRC